MKPAIYIFTDWFWPAYKAGGPVQSLLHLCAALEDGSRVYVIAGATDLGEEKAFGVALNQWTRVVLPGTKQAVNVWYHQGRWTLPPRLKAQEARIVYLNGIYSFHHFIKPLVFLHRKSREQKVVVCPRGMLQAGALSVKPLKKSLYLNVLRRTGLLKGVCWHATNEGEASDIRKAFGGRARVIVAPNIPRRPVTACTTPFKEPGQLRLVYLSLITEKKGLLNLLRVLKQASPHIRLDIYGPVKDKAYWQSCKAEMTGLGGRAVYRGHLVPGEVQACFAAYDASILLTRGENFGHALYESLSAARPVITSYFTPWNKLEQNRAGWNVDISDDGDVAGALNRIAALTAPEFSPFCQGAYRMASAYYNNLSAEAGYHQLFSLC